MSESVSEWLAKGEVLDRYYNPGNFFDSVDLVLTNDDHPSPDLVQRLAGTARVEIRNVPTPPGLFRRSFGYRPARLRGWARAAVEIARDVRPVVVRCYGANLNGFAAAEIKHELGIPYAVSLHVNPDTDIRRRASGRARVVAWSLNGVEAYALRRADLVLPVYKPIVPYLQRLGVDRYRVLYNMLNGEAIRRKSDYELHRPVRVISVGRQFDAKNPERLIRAIGSLDGVHLTLVGDGPLHDHLVAAAAATGRPEQFTFHRALDNHALCALLADQDIFATHSDYFELSKAVIEALLTGLPVVVNRRRGEPVPELEEGIARLVPDDEAAWRDALTDLIASPTRREELGRGAAETAWREWSPDATEGAFVKMYAELTESTGSREAA